MYRAWLIALVGCGHLNIDAPVDSDAMPTDTAGDAPFETLAPVKISSGLVCTAGPANSSPKLAIDDAGAVYAVMMCGSTAQVAISRDRGKSYTAPFDLSSDLPAATGPIAQVAVARGPDDVVYAAVIGSNNEVHLKASPDRGLSWGTAVDIGASADSGAGLALVAHEDDVYVGFMAPAGGVAVARNHARGAGSFDITTVQIPVHFLHVLYDAAARTLVVATDDPQYHVRLSTDAGATFGAQVDPPGGQFNSDWAVGGGKLYASGTNSGVSGTGSAVLYVMSAANPGSLVAVTGLPLIAGNQVRSVAADAAGDAYVASQLDDGSIQLDHLRVGAAAVELPRSITVTGEAPIVAPLSAGHGVAVMFTLGTQVWVGIQTF